MKFHSVVVILGGGPSLTASQIRDVAWARLDGRCRVIAVNDSVYLAWWADWLHAADGNWWRTHIQRVQHFKGIKTTIDPTVPTAWVSGVFNPTGVIGFDKDPYCIRTGNGSGYQAIHCAMQACAKRIVLLGFDMQGDHWHSGHVGEAPTNHAETMVKHFDTLVPTLKELKIDIVNCSPGSALWCFPRAELLSVL